MFYNLSHELQCVGFQQITGLDAVKSLTVPAGATLAVVCAEAQKVRMRPDGTDPTAAIGMVLPVDTNIIITGHLGKYKFIEATATAKLNVSYYR